MAQQGFIAQWIHRLTSNGAERVSIPPQASYQYREEANAALAREKAAQRPATK